MTDTHTNPGVMPDLPEALKRSPVAPASKPGSNTAKAAPVKAKPAKAAKPAKQVKAKAVKEAKADVRRSIVPSQYKVKYAATEGTCGDRLALALKEATTTKNKDGRDCLDVAALKTIAKANGVDVSKYDSLNNGQKRMDVGNKLRGKLLAGETVKVGSQQFTSKTGMTKTPGVLKAQAEALAA